MGSRSGILGLAAALLAVGVVIGWAFVWIIAGVALVVLVGVIVAFYRRGEFSGPRVLVDDTLEGLYGADPEIGDRDRVVEMRTFRRNKSDV